MKTPAIQRRFRLLRELGCLACAQLGYRSAVVEIHHLVDFGYRALSGGDWSTIPLCPWHHRGEPLSGRTKTITKALLGPSLAEDKRAFVRQFGAERKLLAQADRALQTSLPTPHEDPP